jgi:hypothetical protein
MRRCSCAEKYTCMHARLALFVLKEYIYHPPATNLNTRNCRVLDHPVALPQRGEIRPTLRAPPPLPRSSSSFSFSSSSSSSNSCAVQQHP